MSSLKNGLMPSSFHVRVYCKQAGSDPRHDEHEQQHVRSGTIADYPSSSMSFASQLATQG